MQQEPASGPNPGLAVTSWSNLMRQQRHARCAAGHDCWPNPGRVLAGGGVCPLMPASQSARAEYEPAAGVIEDHRAEPAHLIGAEQASDAGRALEPGDRDGLRT